MLPVLLFSNLFKISMLNGIINSESNKKKLQMSTDLITLFDLNVDRSHMPSPFDLDSASGQISSLLDLNIDLSVAFDLDSGQIASPLDLNIDLCQVSG